jgi:hypothetical protein
VCLLSHFIKVHFPAKGFIDVQTQVLGGVDIFSTCPWMVYLDCSGVLVVICRTFDRVELHQPLIFTFL